MVGGSLHSGVARHDRSHGGSVGRHDRVPATSEAPFTPMPRPFSRHFWARQLDLHSVLGALLLRQGEILNAITEYCSAIRLDPDSPSIARDHTRFARALHEKGELRGSGGGLPRGHLARSGLRRTAHRPGAVIKRATTGFAVASVTSCASAVLMPVLRWQRSSTRGVAASARARGRGTVASRVGTVSATPPGSRRPSLRSIVCFYKSGQRTPIGTGKCPSVRTPTSVPFPDECPDKADKCPAGAYTL